MLNDPALLLQRSYWLDYCRDYCPPPPTFPIGDPQVEVLAVNDEGSEAVAMVSYISQRLENAPISVRAIVRVSDTTAQGWQITMLDEWLPEDRAPDVPTGELKPLASPGRLLTAAYLELVTTMTETDAYPSDSTFADGQFTDGFLESLATHKEREPWEEETFEEDLAAGNGGVGFTISAEDRRSVHCALYAWSSTVRHRDGKSITPLPVLGDFAHLMPDGNYASFTVEGYDWICIIEHPNDRPFVLTYDSSRTGVTGVSMELS